MLVRFSCGCLGLANVPGGKGGRDAVVLSACDLPTDVAHEPLGVYRRDLSDKTHTPLEAEEALELLNELGKLVFEGYKFRQVQMLLAPVSAQ